MLLDVQRRARDEVIMNTSAGGSQGSGEAAEPEAVGAATLSPHPSSLCRCDTAMRAAPCAMPTTRPLFDALVISFLG